MHSIKDKHKKRIHSTILCLVLVCILAGISYVFFMENDLHDKDLSAPMKDIILKQVPKDEGFL